MEILGSDSVLEEEVIKTDDPSKEEDATKSNVDLKRAAKDKRVRSLIKMSLRGQNYKKDFWYLEGFGEGLSYQIALKRDLPQAKVCKLQNG